MGLVEEMLKYGEKFKSKKNKSKMKILITGGAGFIGSHLSEKYLESGDEVHIIDDVSTGSLDNIKHINENKNFSDNFYVTIDTILNEERMCELIEDCDKVIHLAAAVGVKTILYKPLDSINTNVLGTEIVLKYCNKFKKKVLVASSSEVYGKQNKAPLVETDDVTYGSSDKLRWSYAVAKLMDEFTALAYYREKNLPVLIVRFFNIVGPRQTGRYGMVIPTFIKQALSGEPLTVHGKGTQTRTFTHVDEVCDCIVKLMETQNAVGEIINIGGVEEISIKDLAERIIKKTGSESKIKFIPYNEVYTPDFEDMPRRVPSTEKLKSILGFAPKKELNTILDDVIHYFKNNKIQ